MEGNIKLNEGYFFKNKELIIINMRYGDSYAYQTANNFRARSRGFGEDYFVG
jgi:hypothetical protein